MFHSEFGLVLGILIIVTLFCEIKPAATYLSEKINPKVAQRISRLKNSFTDLSTNTIIIVDGDNVRGKTKFSASKEQLCRDLDSFVSLSGIESRVVLMYDHGNEHEAFLFGSLAVCFSGPGRTADDVIARDLVWFQRRFNCSVVVVTADTGLKTRCFQGGRITGNHVSIVDSTQFVELLGSTVLSTEANMTASEAMAYSDPSNIGVPLNEVTPQAILSVEALRSFTSERMNVLRRELGIKNQIRSIEKFVKGGCGKKKMVKLQKRAAELDKRLKKVISEESVSLGATLDEAMNMSPEFQEAGYQALVGMLRAGSTRGREETWERVLLAERFRNTLLANRIAVFNSSRISGDAVEMKVQIEVKAGGATDDSSSVAITDTDTDSDSDTDSDTRRKPSVTLQRPLETYITEINQNFSKTNATLELERWMQRKENASLSQPIVSVSSEANTPDLDNGGMPVSFLPPVATSSELYDGDSIVGSVFMIRDISSSMIPVLSEGASSSSVKLSPIHEQILIQQQRLKNEKELEVKRREEMTEEERLRPVRSQKALLMMAKSLSGPRMTNNVPFTVNAEGSRVYTIESLSRTSSSKKKRGEKKELQKPEDEDVTGVLDTEDISGSLRIVCVSDTHGMENVFTGSIPNGDVFIHAGDFAADKGKSRLKLKQLDEWMATLPHELKIVVRGNHDPLGGCFPLSKAIYAERATTVMFKGVAIGLAPHGTINVPHGSVVVSHEPPYGVLDQALGKKKPHVGSLYLQKSAMRLVDKPQLWIFGHIHEGFGAVRTTFGSKGLTPHPKGAPLYSSTLCVNAANANPGPAHSLDNLPICIDITNISDAKERVDDGGDMVDLKPVL